MGTQTERALDSVLEGFSPHQVGKIINDKYWCHFFMIYTGIMDMSLSSPESARAVTGRRCPHSGRGEDFLSRQPDFFTETAVTPERKVEKSFPRWKINRHVEG